MRLIKNTTELIGIKDQNIKISLVFETDTHIAVSYTHLVMVSLSIGATGSPSVKVTVPV